ncbi:rCG52379, isoform CRA_b, partial [Rattus norvegicus]
MSVYVCTNDLTVQELSYIWAMNSYYVNALVSSFFHSV